jgi:hypothetical protein
MPTEAQFDCVTEETDMLAEPQTEEMTDEEESAFNAAVADPSTIATEKEAAEILECLDDDIAGIRHQLNAAKIEADVCGTLSEQRQEWVRRAAGALAWKIKQRAAVGRRLGDLRPPPPPVAAPDPVISKIVRNVSKKVAGKHLCLQLEEALRVRQAEKIAAKAQNIIASNQRDRSQAELFLLAAKNIYSTDENQKTWDRAREMFPDDPCWNQMT